MRRVIGGQVTDALAATIDDVHSGVAYRVDRRGRESARQLRTLKDRYRGHRCFIIGNGPSLNLMDLRPLRDEYTFGLNRGHLLGERIGKETTFLVSVNRYVIAQSASEMIAAPSMKFLSWHARSFVPDRTDVTLLRSVRRPQFSSNPARDGVWEGATVTYVAMQLAYYFGFQAVIIIGVDHSFSSQGPPHKLVTSKGNDPNHFDPNYFGAGYRWQLPDLEMSERAYRLARARFAASGREIVDATVGGKLTVFPKAEYTSLFDLGRIA
jgi:hypothetical protein